MSDPGVSHIPGLPPLASHPTHEIHLLEIEEEGRIKPAGLFQGLGPQQHSGASNPVDALCGQMGRKRGFLSREEARDRAKRGCRGEDRNKAGKPERGGYGIALAILDPRPAGTNIRVVRHVLPKTVYGVIFQSGIRVEQKDIARRIVAPQKGIYDKVVAPSKAVIGRLGVKGNVALPASRRDNLSKPFCIPPWRGVVDKVHRDFEGPVISAKNAFNRGEGQIGRAVIHDDDSDGRIRQLAPQT